MEYLEQLKNKKEYEKCAAFFTYVIATRSKYLQLMTIYYIYKGDKQREAQEFRNFNSFCKDLGKLMIQKFEKKFEKICLKTVKSFCEKLSREQETKGNDKIEKVQSNRSEESFDLKPKLDSWPEP